MSEFNRHKEMLALVAHALGDDLVAQTAFVGGCTTGLLITDDMSRENVRHTDDVDLIVSVIGYTGWHKFSELLQARGFTISMNDTVNCRFRLQGLQVDFMPDDAEVLGFSNRWYKQALHCATNYELAAGTLVRLVTPAYFLATKFEAFKGRGNNDLLGSHDIEDILNVIDGRESLLDELQSADIELQNYLSTEANTLLAHRDTLYALQSTANGNVDRQNLIYDRIDRISKLGAES
ncbi:MAG: hypothetical protein COA42_06525 [Alteromonadaceae bacterium]|nr:MAG: hypothetical protein COA42_06525 [Alteromonadaceae bacterium]